MDSALNKLLDYFRFEIIERPIFKLSKMIESVNLNNTANNTLIYSNENQFNRIKGFIYGYYMGFVKGVKPETAQMLKIKKRVYDIIASINSNKGISNQAFNNELKELDAKYTNLDPNIQYSKKCWCDFAKKWGLTETSINELLRTLNVESEAKNNFCKHNNIILRKNISEFNNHGLSQYIQEMSIHINSIVIKDKIEKERGLKLCEHLDVNPDYSMAMLSDTDNLSSLYNEILNRIIWSDALITINELRVNRSEVAERVVRILIDIFNEKKWNWIGTPIQLYYHHLRENIHNFTPFDLCEIDNVVYQSLAAFILKGDDFESLIAYMEANAISDYKYTLGLWGATLGYVQISKRIIEQNIKKSSFSRLYNEVYLLLFKKQYLGTLQLKPIELLNHESKNSFIDNKKKLIDFAYNEIKGREKNNLIGSLMELLKRYDDDIDYEIIIRELLNAEEWKTKSGAPKNAWNKIKDYFAPSLKINKPAKQKRNNINEIRTLFDSEKHFYNDVNAWDIIKSIIPIGSQKAIKKDLEWFQNELCKPQYERYRYYQDIDVVNDLLVINKFCKLKEGKTNYFTSDIREQVKLILLKYYGCK